MYFQIQEGCGKSKMAEVNRNMNHDEESEGSPSEYDMEEDEDDYYDYGDDDLVLDCPSKTDDPEYFEYECLSVMDAERLLNEETEALCTRLKVSYETYSVSFV